MPDDPLISFVPTPIGNLGDITLRALDALREADLVACEDTRHSRRLLNHFDIKKPLLSLHDHNEERRVPELLAKARQGTRIAVVSDAGTPCLSDPGYRLLRACIEEHIPYIVLPGPSAITTALVASGLPPYPFTFRGFLPIKKGKRRRALEDALASKHTHVFFESPHRLVSTLELLMDINPQCRVCITRELTKKFENIYGGTPRELLEEFTAKAPKGEVTLLIHS